eukprot:Anaeramoba_ignava/a220319_111.p1 GENE.a220319_111~~a220319_111.p1  ORF type:complete len:431 (-),score=-23.20 a220319_111:176-1468(-)
MDDYNNYNTSEKPFSDPVNESAFSLHKHVENGSKYSEKRRDIVLPAALAIATSHALRNQKYIFSNPLSPLLTLKKHLTKRQIHQNDDVAFTHWQDADKFQQGMVFGLVMQLAVARDNSDDMIFPFTVRPLRTNKTFYNASDAVLANKFTDHLTKELKTLGIDQPEFYYNITGKGKKRHIHGSVRLPPSFHDVQRKGGAPAIKSIHDALKRSCGLTPTQHKQISGRDNRNKLYKFAISAPNAKGGFTEQYNNFNNPYGHMVYVDEPLFADLGQIGWSPYILTNGNVSNNKIKRTKNLAAEAKRVNDLLYSRIEELRSCRDWGDNTARFEIVTKGWADVLFDYVMSSSNTNEERTTEYTDTYKRAEPTVNIESYNVAHRANEDGICSEKPMSSNEKGITSTQTALHEESTLDDLVAEIKELNALIEKKEKQS